MTDAADPASYFIGWDVGGWNCDKNDKSRDAIVVVDAERRLVGKPWRGNLTSSINAAPDTEAFVALLFGLCQFSPPSAPHHVTLAIDTPLGFSLAFQQLITQLEPAGPIGGSASNPYLFRDTEQFLFRHGLRPLSAVKDMIGSQATKGMHVLARFAPTVPSCGVWTDGQHLTAIEAYPSACKASPSIHDLRAACDLSTLRHDDQHDALTCALIAHLHARHPEQLAAPPDGVSSSEGWIWAPRDVIAAPMAR